MKKIDWNKAMTRKDYAIICAIGFVFGTASVALMSAIAYWDEIKTWVADKIKKVKNGHS